MHDAVHCHIVLQSFVPSVRVYVRHNIIHSELIHSHHTYGTVWYGTGTLGQKTFFFYRIRNPQYLHTER